MVKLISCTRSRVAQTIVALFLGVLLMAGPAVAQPLTMSAGLAFSSRYRTNCWQPIHLEFRNDGSAAVEGSVVVPLSDPQAPSAMVLPLTIPPLARVTRTVWAYFPPAAAVLRPQEPRTDDVPPLAMAEFRGRDGSLITRAPLSGVPLSGMVTKESADRSGSGELILVIGQRERPDDELYEPSWLIGPLSETVGIPMAVANITLDRVPREAVGLQAIKAIVLDAVDPESFDPAQREAVIQYVRGGGVIVIAAPGGPIDKAGTWLAPLLPLKLVGSREVRQITMPDGNTLKMRGAVPIIEAIEAGGGGGGGGGSGAVALLRDRDYVHVAARPVGLGKVVFTSFPINALDPAQPQAAVLWEQLLELRRPQWDWNRTRLGEARHDVLGAMIGRPVPPWGLAAGVAAGYLLVIGAAQLIFFGPARPRAFVVSIVAAGVLAAALVAMGVARRGESKLQSARLAVMEVTADGGGWAHESRAYVGADDPEMNLAAADESVMLRPALADAQNRPTVRQQPFRADAAQVFADRIERVWEASAPVDPALRLRAAAQFGADGLTLDVDNALGATIESPLVIWNGRSVAMADLPVGRTTVRAFEYNPRQQFTGLSALRSDLSKRRAQIVAASLTPANELSTGNRAVDARPMLVGWIASGGGGGGGDDERHALVRAVDRGAIETKSMIMVRTPLGVNVPPAGSTVHIPPALVRVDTGRLPYDHEKGESVATPQPGSWRIRFAPPPQTGRVKPTRMTVSARVSVPSHTLRLRPASRGAADERQWSRTVGAIELPLDCTERDYDANGAVEMVMDVESHEPASSVSWQISDLVATIDGVVAGPPPAIVLGPTTRPKDESDAEPAEQEK